MQTTHARRADREYMHEHTHGFHPRSEGLTKSIPALDTVERLAYFRCPISNISLMESVSGTRSLLARVRTCVKFNLIGTRQKLFLDSKR